MKTCENCGCRVYSNGCVNCNEELYILDQYYEQDMELPDEDTEFMKKASEQQERLSAVIDSFDSLADEQRLEIMNRYDKNVGCRIENCR